MSTMDKVLKKILEKFILKLTVENVPESNLKMIKEMFTTLPPAPEGKPVWKTTQTDGPNGANTSSKSLIDSMYVTKRR